MAETQDVRAEELGLFTTDEGSPEVILPRRRTLKRVIIGLALAVLVAVGAVTGPIAYRIVQQKDADIATPATIAELTLDTSADAKDTTEYLRTALSAGLDLDETVAAVYLVPTDEPRTVVFFGGTGLVWSPDKELEELFDLLADTTGGVEQVTDVAAGSLGGVMRCGVTPTDSAPLTVCGWADHGSVAVALFPQRTVAEAGKLLGQMRTAMELRN